MQLQTAIENELTSQSVGRLAALTAELSMSYRNGMPCNGENYIRSWEDAAAYAAFRLPATFAAVYSALIQVKDRCPEWDPKTLLDAGAGPGTAMWAVSDIWPDLERITLLEREESMIDLGKRLASHSPIASVQEAEWLKTDIAGAWEVLPHDLVVAAYVLNELPQDSGKAFIQRLWESTAGMLVIIEPGTPAGFLRINQAREQLKAAGAKTVAPCPHDGICPMTEGDWCHFAQRVARSRLHRKVKAGELPYEDEKFSFICMSRMSRPAVDGVVIRHPQIRKGHIYLETCTPEGLTSTVVTRKDKELFRKARRLRWGSAIPANDDRR